MPDAANLKQITNELEKVLLLEHKYKSNILIAKMDHKAGEAVLIARDTAVRSMRFLKFWLHLPCEVFFTAVNLLDRFLTRMKVHERFLACISISCLYTAAEIHKCNVNAAYLITLSQTKCSIKDMHRMCDIIRKKLDVEPREQPVTVYTYLNLFLRIYDCYTAQLNLKSVAPKKLQKKVLRRRLEVIMTNHLCASKRAPAITLSLIRNEIQKYAATQNQKSNLMKLILKICDYQAVCMIPPDEFLACSLSIGQVLKEYDDHCKMSIVQKLKWRFSLSPFTSRPLDRFHTNLNRISEDA